MRCPSAQSPTCPPQIVRRAVTGASFPLFVFCIIVVPVPGWRAALVPRSQLRLRVQHLCERSFGSCFGRRIKQFNEESTQLAGPLQKARQLRTAPLWGRMSQPPPASLKKEKQKQQKMVMSQLQSCMKAKDVHGAKEVFKVLKGGDNDKKLSPHVYSMMINLLGGEQQMEDALNLFLELKSFHGTPVESVYASMIRASSSTDLPLARSLLSECIEHNVDLKLRVVQPLLSRLLKEHRLAEFFAALERILSVQPQLFSITASSSVAPVEGLLVDAIAQCGFALTQTQAIENDTAAAAAGETSAEDTVEDQPTRQQLVAWLDDLLGHMALNCLSVTRTSAERLRQGLLPVAAVVRADADGVCPRTGAQLQRLGLTSGERATVREGLLEVAGAVSDEQRSKLESFREWVESRSEPFSVVIDGPNVAYSRQNFEGGCFSYHQIELVRQKLLAQGQHALVLLPWKYLQPVIPNHARFQTQAACSKHEVTAEEQAIIDQWGAEEVLSVSPLGANDDWYWMMASVAGDGLVAVVSNDLMRDHRLALLEPRPFLRWKSTQIQRFDLDHAYEPARIAADEIPVPTVTLSPPVVFSSEIQRISRGAHVTWHVPIVAEDAAGAAVQPQHAEQACTSTTLFARGLDQQDHDWLSIALHEALPEARVGAADLDDAGTV